MPALVVLGFVYVYPIFKNLLLSVHNARFIEHADFVGLANYKRLLTDKNFWNSVLVLLKYTCLYTVGVFLIGFVTALILDRNASTSKSLFRTIFVLPYAIPDVVAAMVFLWILDYQFGIANHLIQLFGLSHGPINWLGQNRHVSLLTIIGIELWRQYPLHTLIILSGLQDIPSELYEAADIEGAGFFCKLTKITIPYLKQVLSILLTMTIIWCLRRFTMIWLLTQGGPNRGTETIVIQIYSYAFQFNKMSYAAAIGNMLLLFTICLLLLYFHLMRRKTEE